MGTARFAYNWGLAKWEEMYKEGLKPNGKELKKIFNNGIKKEEKLNKKLKRLQKQSSRKYEMNKNGIQFIKTKNIMKLEKEIKLTYRKLTNIKNNHIHQATNSIIKLKPSDRIYKCGCGLVMDRDKNASINLSNYELA